MKNKDQLKEIYGNKGLGPKAFEVLYEYYNKEDIPFKNKEKAKYMVIKGRFLNGELGFGALRTSLLKATGKTPKLTI